MWSTGVISNYAFALNHNTTSRRGSIAFGGDGVDMSQIDGGTITRPLVIYPNSPRYRITAIGSVFIGNNSVLLPGDYVLDNRADSLYLPSNMTNLILSQF